MTTGKRADSGDEDGGGFNWREAFDALLVFDQDFDTAMEILMYQDEKVARLSLEEPRVTRRRSGTPEINRSGNGLSSDDRPYHGGAKRKNKKRRRTDDTAGFVARADAPTPPLGGYTSSGDSICSPEMLLPIGELPDADCHESQRTGAIVNGEASGAVRIMCSVPVEPTPMKVPAGYEEHDRLLETGTLGSSSATDDRWSDGDNLNGSTDNRSAEERIHRVCEELQAGGDTVPSLFQNANGARIGLNRSRLEAYSAVFIALEKSGNALLKDGLSCRDTSDADKGVIHSGVKGSGPTPMMALDADGVTASGNAFLSLRPPGNNSGHAACGTADSSLFPRTERDEHADTASNQAAMPTSDDMFSSLQVSSDTRNRGAQAPPRDYKDGVNTGRVVEKSLIDAGGKTRQSGWGGASEATTVGSLFQTGSGKAVKISKDRLQHYEAELLDDEGMMPAGLSGPVQMGRRSASAKTDVSPAIVVSLFRTGSGKTMTMSKDRLREYDAKLMVEDDKDVAGAAGASNKRRESRTEAPLTTISGLFQTGAGKAVQISKVRLQEYESKLLAGEEMERVESTGNGVTHPSGRGETAPVNAETPTATISSLFRTGSGSVVQISKARLRECEAKLMVEEEGAVLPEGGVSSRRGTTNQAEGPSNSARALSLFQTSSGKSIRISNDRLRDYEAKLLVAEEKEAPMSKASAGEGHTAYSGISRTPQTSKPTPSSEFHPGSGKTVQISNDRLRDYEAKLTLDAEKDMAMSIGPSASWHSEATRISTTPVSSSATMPSLFQTGAGKAVNISMDRLREYEVRLMDEGKMAAVDSAGSGSAGAARSGSSTSAEMVAPSTSVSSLFQTGSGKAVKILKDRMRAYEAKLMADEEMDRIAGTGPSVVDRTERDGVVETDASATTVSNLFQTGSGKAVKISKARLQDYERQLRDDDSRAMATAVAANSSEGRVGQANGATKMESDASSTPISSLFQTGSGKTVKISEARLRAYQAKLLADEEKGPSVNCAETAIRMVENGRLSSIETSASTVSRTFGTSAVKHVSSSTIAQRDYETRETSNDSSEAVHEGDDRAGRRGPVLPHTESASQLSPFDDKLRENGAIGAQEREHAARGRLSGALTLVKDASILRAIDSNEQFGTNGPRNSSLQTTETGLRPTRQYLRNASPQKDEENQVHGVGSVLETSMLKGSKGLKPPAHVKQVQSTQPMDRPPRLPMQRQAMLSKASAKPPTGPIRRKMSGNKRFHPPVASKNMSVRNSAGIQGSRPPVAPQSKKRKVSGEAQPFKYVEAMKISFSHLLSVRADDDPRPAGNCELPYVQVLNSVTSANATDVLFKRKETGPKSIRAPSVYVYPSSQGAYDSVVFVGPRELYGQLIAGNHIIEAMGATYEWFLNHYRWIIWKLAATERSFPRFLLEKYLTKDQVMLQMSRRYQRELHGAQRSVLKKILNRDASSLSCMVLCIAAVLPFPVGKEQPVDQELPAHWNLALVLTDGWYAVYAVPDAPLAAALWKLHQKASLIGSKIATWNASLQNSTEGIDPLECAIVRESQWKNPLLAKEDLTQWPYLQLRYNSTRRVEFGTRLGVEKLHYAMVAPERTRKQQPQLTFSLLKSVPLKSLEVGGGMARSVRIRVTRISPVLHLQSKEWTLGPRILCEEQLQLYFQLRSEFSRMVADKQHRLADSEDGGSEYAAEERLDAPLPMPFVKLDVECTHPSVATRPGIGCGVLTVWRPSEELLSGGLKEGAEYFVSSLTVNWKIDGGRGQDASLRLSSTKSTSFEKMEDEASSEGDRTGSLQCVDVQQATTDYRANFERGLNGRRNERRPTVDVCVCVVFVAARETHQLDGSSASGRKQAEESLLDPALKPKEARFVEHVFVTDRSHHLMSIRVSGMEVSMAKENNATWSRRGSASSFVFRRGSKNVWKEGAVVCLSGLEISHYDEQLRVLDCVLVESTQIVSFPSKKSHFHADFHLLQRELGVSTTRGQVLEDTSDALLEQVAQLKKYVQRSILLLDFVLTQEDQVAELEQERLTQELETLETGDSEATGQAGASSTTRGHQFHWDAAIVKMLPLLGTSRRMFPREVIALASVSIGSDDQALRTVYLAREAMLSLRALLQPTGVHHDPSDKESSDATAEEDAALVRSVIQMLHTLQRGEQSSSRSAFRFQVRQTTSERLLNSWKPWERLHASHWMGFAVAPVPASK
ncbi:hypothetical protein BBJ28_00019710 [Nothophytophthora sp. Chile5]|nr:hypothetical protein BBJ28_00019710 [Nothophytophthora sp. Chile5]